MTRCSGNCLPWHVLFVSQEFYVPDAIAVAFQCLGSAYSIYQLVFFPLNSFHLVRPSHHSAKIFKFIVIEFHITILITIRKLDRENK